MSVNFALIVGDKAKINSFTRTHSENPNCEMPDSLLPIPPEMSTISDSLLSVAAALLQLVAAVIFVTNCEFVRSFGWILQSTIVAAVMVGYFSAERFIMNWRSKRQIGERIDSVAVSFSCFVVPTVLSFGVAVSLGKGSVETLLVNGLLAIVASYLVDLSRADVPSDIFPGILHGMLMPSIFYMKGQLYWVIGFGVVMSALVYVVCSRREKWVAVKKAEDLRKEEAEQGKKTEKVAMKEAVEEKVVVKEAEEKGEKTEEHAA